MSRRSARGEGVVIFCGPSLACEEARRLGGAAQVLPPARQGDVYRCLSAQPRVIALIDGVFESVPSVWHRELLAALEAGVHVLGASSMGALRAAELEPFGMVGVGRVFEAVRSGELTDDAEVALLHATSEHAHRALTVPLVTALHALDAALRGRKVSAEEHGALSSAARGMHYQTRTWPELFEQAALAPERRAALLKWLRTRAPDVKRDDARACISRAVKLAAGPTPPPRLLRPAPSHARIAQLLQSVSLAGRRALSGAEVLESLSSRDDAQMLEDAGMRRLLLAAYARATGFVATAAELEAGTQAWLAEAGIDRTGLAELGLDEGQLRRIGETVALERKVLDHAQRLFPDGPAAIEAIALAARTGGQWRKVTRRREPKG